MNEGIYFRRINNIVLSSLTKKYNTSLSWTILYAPGIFVPPSFNKCSITNNFELERRRIKHLEDLLLFIEENGSNERNSNLLADKLRNELHCEISINNDYNSNEYLNNLRQTKDKEWAEYIEVKDTKKSSAAYKRFVEHFQHDISSELFNIRS